MKKRSPIDHEWIKQQCLKLEEAKVIKRSTSNYAAPVVVVGKKDGDKRMTVDFGALNNITPKFEFPMPYPDSAPDEFHGCVIWTAIDLANAFYQIMVHPDSTYKLAFMTKDGLWEFLVMPFGIKNAPATFQYLMYLVLGDYLNKFVSSILTILLYTQKASKSTLPTCEWY